MQRDKKMVKKCDYCLKVLEHKVYPSGHVESELRFSQRRFCDLYCYYAGRAFETVEQDFNIANLKRKKAIKDVENEL